jgi:hypothetical protein
LSSNPNFNSSASLQREIDCFPTEPPLPHIKTGTVEMEVVNLVIAILETGQSFECASDWIIGDAEEGIRREFVFTGGAIK